MLKKTQKKELKIYTEKELQETIRILWQYLGDPETVLERISEGFCQDHEITMEMAKQAVSRYGILKGSQRKMQIYDKHDPDYETVRVCINERNLQICPQTIHLPKPGYVNKYMMLRRGNYKVWVLTYLKAAQPYIDRGILKIWKERK